MEKKKLGIGWLIIAYVMLAACIGGAIFMLITKATEMGVGKIVIGFVEAIAVLAAISYFAKGYKKDAAKYFKVSMLLFSSTFLLDYLFMAIFPIEIAMAEEASFSIFYFVIFLMLIQYGNFLLLSVAKDLGKVWSYILLAINLVINIFYLVSVILSSELDFVSTWFTIQQCLMNLVFFIMVKAKYIDKSNRAENL